MSAVPVRPALSPVECVSAYLEWLELRVQLRTLSKGALRKATYHLSDFARFCPVSFEECRSDLLLRWLAARPRWKSASTKSDALSAVMSCFRWAADERHIPYVPFRRPKGAAIKPKPRAAFTDADYKAFRLSARKCKKKAVGIAVRCYVFAMWESGARTCEIRLCLWPQIRWDKRYILQKHHKTERTGEPRIIAMSQRLIRLLRWMERRRVFDPRPCQCELATEKGEEHAIQDHVFLNSVDKPWSKDTFSANFRRIARRAGIDRRKSAYSSRHGFTCRCIRARFSDRETAHALGQRTTSYVEWYGRELASEVEHLTGLAERASARRRNGELPLFPA